MTLSKEIWGEVDKWVVNNRGQECGGEDRKRLLKHLKDMQPGKDNRFLQTQLTRLLGKTRGVVKPECTPKKYNPKPIGDPTGKSKEVRHLRIRHPGHHQGRRVPLAEVGTTLPHSSIL